MTLAAPSAQPLDARKFRDPVWTAKGERRATVGLNRLHTLWFNTGTLCNLTCRNCYIESSPTNDRLVYLTVADVERFLDEIAMRDLPTEEIGFTGGEPFLNAEIIAMLTLCLERGFRVLVLTNAMRPMMRFTDRLRAVQARFGNRLVIRVSLDHYGPALHDLERGPGSFDKTIAGLRWLVEAGFTVHVAGRTFSGQTDVDIRRGFATLFTDYKIPVNAEDPVSLVLFPEMDADVDVPEITEQCWGLLKVSPDAMMCATSRMVVKRKGTDRPAVVSCTLLPYEKAFEMGHTLAEAAGDIPLNHPNCAKFCVLGGGSCSKA